ncbi:hypothetical protein ACFSM5_11735 [Lacibacterium aquatile]|uniref:J domain-containing protein n=1 Tax=Lacibacterium aquatile TaxID=1168082 RepID=A0ABW5DR80_9PROT
MPSYRASEQLGQFTLFPGLGTRSDVAIPELAKTVSLTLSLPRADKLRLERLARDKGETPARLVQSAMMLASSEIFAGLPPLLAGDAQLKLRLPVDISEEDARSAVALVLALADGSLGKAPAKPDADRILEARDAVERLAFEPLPSGVRSPRQAAHVMGFPGELGLTEAQVSARFRKLAPVYHPDTGFIAGDRHMGQLIEARRILLDYMRGD